MNVSIIIPVYNVAPYISKCLSSVIHQTYNRLEVILVDDCGVDDSIEIAEQLISEYEGPINFRVLHHEKNRGLSSARNTGIKASTGDFLFFLDSDDFICNECIELLVNSVVKFQDSQIVFSSSEASQEGYEWLDYTNKEVPEYTNNRDWIQESMLKRYDLGMTAWNKLISRDFLIQNNLFFKDGLVHEDELWNFQIAQFVRHISIVKETTYYYNVRNDSLITASVSEHTKWNRLFLLWIAMKNEIGGYRKQTQIKAICRFILEKTRWDFPKKHKKSLGLLYFTLAIKAHSSLSFPLFLQGLITLFYPAKYPNQMTCSRISL